MTCKHCGSPIVGYWYTMTITAEDEQAHGDLLALCSDCVALLLDEAVQLLSERKRTAFLTRLQAG